MTGEAVQPSVTNNQEAGVDEGGIVKVRGDIVVILRRGRLFTLSIAGEKMRLISAIDCFPPGVDARHDWYDEMLIAANRVVVIGYSYGRDGTQINRFRMDREGRLTFEDAYQLGSQDYYSSRNYASRRIGNRLVLYAPVDLDSEEKPLESMPKLGFRRPGQAEPMFKRIAGAANIFVPALLRRDAKAEVSTLHTVVACDLTAPTLDCKAQGMLGGYSRTFYVSPTAVYVWTEQDLVAEDDKSPSAFLYRLPLDGGRPKAIAARGGPIDQFSFREDAAQGLLNILVRSEFDGDGMWRPEFSEGAVALIRMPLSDFGVGDREIPKRLYRDLPRPPKDSWTFRNRFVGDYVLYGFETEENATTAAALVVAPIRGGQPVRLAMPASVDRIEAMARDAVVVGGNDNGVHFTAIELTAGPPRVGDRHSMLAASEAESRSHAFFFRVDPGIDVRVGSTGVIGLPIARPSRAPHSELFDTAASMAFLRRAHRKFSPLGELEAHEAGVVDDGCKVSCVDWYGNARPVFVRRRIFALLGFELVEGVEVGGRIREVARLNFAPPPPVPSPPRK